MRGSVESPFEAQLHETVVIGLNTGDTSLPQKFEMSAIETFPEQSLQRSNCLESRVEGGNVKDYCDILL